MRPHCLIALLVFVLSRGCCVARQSERADPSLLVIVDYSGSMLGAGDEIREELRRILNTTTPDTVVQIIEARDDSEAQNDAKTRRWPVPAAQRRRITTQSFDDYVGHLLIDGGDAIDRAVVSAIAERPTRIWIISDGTFDNFDPTIAALKGAHAQYGTVVNVTAVGDFNEAPARWRSVAKECGGVYAERATSP